jgi:hypothetical protein
MVDDRGMGDADVFCDDLQAEAIGSLVHQSLLGGIQDFAAGQFRRSAFPLRGPLILFDTIVHFLIESLSTEMSVGYSRK